MYSIIIEREKNHWITFISHQKWNKNPAWSVVIFFAVTVVTICLHDSCYSIRFNITIRFLLCWYIHIYLQRKMLCGLVHVLKIIQSKNIDIYRKFLIHIFYHLLLKVFFWNEYPFAFISIQSHHFSKSTINVNFLFYFYAWVFMLSSKYSSQVTIIITMCRDLKLASALKFD